MCNEIGIKTRLFQNPKFWDSGSSRFEGAKNFGEI